MINKKYTPDEDEPISLNYDENEEREVCQKCFGSGENLTPGTKCRKCGGTGYPKKSKKIN